VEYCIVKQGGIGPAGLSAEDLHVLDLTQQRPRWHRLDYYPISTSFVIAFIWLCSGCYVELVFLGLDQGHAMDMLWLWWGRGISWQLEAMMVATQMLLHIWLGCLLFLVNLLHVTFVLPPLNRKETFGWCMGLRHSCQTLWMAQIGARRRGPASMHVLSSWILSFLTNILSFWLHLYQFYMLYVYSFFLFHNFTWDTFWGQFFLFRLSLQKPWCLELGCVMTFIN
jgi:hypothetical protein